ncbi:MAG: cupin domain-containing protein [Anaerolineales bacterium]
MEDKLPDKIKVADSNTAEWVEHSRFPGIYVRKLLNSEDNPLANVNEVLVPPGGLIGNHDHPQEVETVYVLAGESRLTLAGEELLFRIGQVVAIPIGKEHSLENIGAEDVRLLTIFTPPIG